MNQVILTGRLTRDPELKVIPSTGTSVTRFAIAVDKDLTKQKKEEMQQAGKSTADFINVVIFGKLADVCNTYLAKGSQVAVQGSIQTGSYEKDGHKVYTTDVLANKVEFLNKVEKKKEQSSDDFDSFDGGFEDSFDAEDVHF